MSREDRSIRAEAVEALPRRVAALVAALAVAVGAIVLGAPPASADYPGYAEVQAAKAAVRKAHASVAELDAAIVRLNNAVHQADVAVREADNAYAEAQERNENAQRELFLANARADEAGRALDKAREELAAVARAEYRTGGEFGAIEAVATSEGFEDVVVRTEALDRAGDTAEVAVDHVRAAELVERTLRQFAQEAAENAVQAEQDASDALQHAIDVSHQADQALADAEVARDEAIAKLAKLRRTSASLERQRQEGLARARSSYHSSGSGGGSSGVPSGTNPPPGGVIRGTEAKGQAAVQFALAQLGEPYVYGAAGPNAWDCSGLTMVAWGRQGVYLPRSSKGQYSYVAKVSYSQLRTGDLIFWGTSRSPSRVYHVSMYIGNNTIVEASRPGVPVKTRDYRNWALSDLMPYAGRP